MPVVEVDPDELRELTGHDEKSDDELKEDCFALGLEFEGETDDGAFELEFGPDRLDRLSVEGVARSLRYQYGDARGVHVPDTNDAEWTIRVEDAPEERPYISGAVVRGVDLDERALESIIQLQEKLHATMGRTRAKGAIGLHDLTMLKGAAGPAGDDSITKSVRYTGVDLEADTFVPLESDAELTPGEVLTEHETGREYADLVADLNRVPAIYDDIGLFSFPPIINGKRTEVTTNSRDLFIESTGTDQWTVDHMVTICCYALAARGGRLEDVTVEYVTDGREHVVPDLTVREKHVTHDRIETTLGVDLGHDEVLDLLERSGLEGSTTEVDGDDADGELGYDVQIPPYRVDVLHPRDVVDDVGRAYGFNDLAPRYPDVSTVGGRHERSRHERSVRETLVALGFEDLLNFHLIGADENYDRMGIERPAPDEGATASSAADQPLGRHSAVRIREPYSEAYELVRTWALPSLLMVLENNTHRAYPQDLAEIGLAARLDPDENTGTRERRTVAGVVARTDAGYEDAKGRLAHLARAYGIDLETPPTEHPTFVDGRTATVVLDGESAGVIGEVHPSVLVEHDLEVPVAAFEFDLSALAPAE
jgi:phenylalanyl-tRNA synthetase beta chain